MVSLFSRFKRLVSEKVSTEKEPKKLRARAIKPESEKKQSFVSQRDQEVIRKAEREAARIQNEARLRAQKISQEAEVLRRRTVDQEAEVSRKAGVLEERERMIKNRKRQVDRQLEEAERVRKQQVLKLEKIASLTREQAKRLILEGTEKKLSEEIARRIREAEENIKAQSEEKAKEILTEAIRRGATDYVVEYTVSTVKLSDEEMKGRIIGREGRNIRAFERAAGVEIELDETDDVSLSSFDPVRREIARRSLEKLVKDRRIRPSRIEEVVGRTRKEMDKILFEEGEKLSHQAQVYRLHPDLIKLLGRYKFRFSYGQNLAIHTLEVVKIGVAIASEVKADINLVRLGCLLHDVGKVLLGEEGTHVDLGIGLVKKYRLPSEVVVCIAEHHEDKPFSSAESRIVWVADAISGARPGARYEPHEGYVKRMTEIEKTAADFEGVEAVYAYQAGREVRVLVKPEVVSDQQLTVLAHKIKQSLEEKVAYVGQVKVTCIRETRVAETTKAK